MDTKFEMDHVNLHSLISKIESLETKIDDLESELQVMKSGSNDITILVTTGDYDKLLTAFILASGAVSIGINVSMFFTFWGISALKKDITYKNKNIYEKLMTFIMPKTPSETPLSNMHMFGVGKVFMCKIMREKGICSLQDIINHTLALGVEVTVCQMTMNMMGISKEELIDEIQLGGVVSCIDKMILSHSTIVL